MYGWRYYSKDIKMLKELSNEEIIRTFRYDDTEEDDQSEYEKFLRFEKEACRVLNNRNIAPAEKLKLAKIGGTYRSWNWLFYSSKDISPYSAQERRTIIDGIGRYACIKFPSHFNSNFDDDLYLFTHIKNWYREQVAKLVRVFAKKHRQHLTADFLIDFMMKYPKVVPEIINLKLLNKQQIATYINCQFNSVNNSTNNLDRSDLDFIFLEDRILAEIISQELVDLEQAISLCIMIEKHKESYPVDTMKATAKLIGQSDYPVEKIVDIAGKIDNKYFNIELLENRELIQKLNGDQIFALAQIVEGDKSLMRAVDTQKLNFEQRYALLGKAQSAEFAREFMASGYGLPDPQ